MAGINKALIIGNVGKVEIRDTNQGDKVVNVSVATSIKFKDKQGNQTEQTEWHNVVFFGKVAEIAAKYLSKGTKVYIEGSLKTEKWQDKQGVDHYTTKIIARDMQMLSSKEQDNQNQKSSHSAPMADYAKGKDEGFIEDEIPF